MSSRNKRRLHHDPLASDPEDLDYGAASSPKPQTRRSRTSKAPSRKPQKRQRRAYADTDDEIVEDEDEMSEGSFGSDTADEPEEEIEVNPRTGRGVRSAAKRNIKYEEPSDEDIEDAAQEEEARGATEHIARNKRARPSLIITLKLPPLKLGSPAGNMTIRQGTRSTRRGTTPEVTGTRRSSRLSHDDQEPMLALTDSGRHTQVVRPGTRSPEPQPTRQTRGGKGPKKNPSVIMEASQEISDPSRGEAAGEAKYDTGAEDAPGEEDNRAQVPSSDAGTPAGSETQADPQPSEDTRMGEAIVQESVHEDEDDDDDDIPITRSARNLRSRAPATTDRPATRSSQKRRKNGIEESSDFEPHAEEKEDENMSDSDESPRKASQKEDTSDSPGGRGPRRTGGRTRSSQRSRRASDDHESELDREELAEEAEELVELNKRRRTRRAQRGIVFDDQPKLRNRGAKPDYRIYRPELALPVDEDEPAPSASQLRNRRGGGSAYRSLFSMAGPFGGATGPPLSGGLGAAGGVDSDSSDDDVQRMPRGIGGTIGMTPTAAKPPGLFPQTLNADPLQAGASGGPANFGRIKDKQLLADADPLGVDQNVNFGSVGGLDDHIARLKEMVALPLLYPEIFQKYHVTPPRGVLFHGPPGTGKTLLARALASSVSAESRKVTFYMRKGADALSKWVGEAERQLRLLFEEARKTQPSIIFFDEIDGLAPVRSSKQDQIHSSIVATLLALMDGMDGRGQVIVIGATNRPDTVDPALRRPGRFDREFYFPLPNKQARRAIIDINTKGWDPPLKPEFKDQLAELTKGYGGADLRALCTEAALNAVQGTYPQIYNSDQKLLIDVGTIKVLAKDFMISVNKMIPSSERSTAATAAPLAKSVQPLLRGALDDIARILEETIPQRKRLTALEEAQFDDRDDELGFERETMQRDFERARIFRPRLLIRGVYGMGQQYLGPALLSRFETLHVQSFDLPTLLEDSTRSPEAAIIQLFKEVRRHKPSVIYIGNVDVWYRSVSPTVIQTFVSMLRSVPPTDPVLVLGLLETTTNDKEELDPTMVRDLFGFSPKNHYVIARPDERARGEYFENLLAYIRKPPTQFPDLENRKKRKLADLEVAPPPPPKAPEPLTKQQLKEQKKHDRHILNLLKMQIQLVMDQIKKQFKRFRTPIIDDSQIQYLYDEQDPTILGTDLTEEQRHEQQLLRPYERDTDKHGVPGLREVATGKFYYNLDTVMIEKRISNGYYKRPSDFLADIKRLAKDAAMSGDADRTMKANELLTNVEVDMHALEVQHSALVAECEAVYSREQAREQHVIEKANQAAEQGKDVPVLTSNVPPQFSGTTTDNSGPVLLGERIPGRDPMPPITPDRRVGHELLSNGDMTSTGGGSHPRQSNGSTVPSRHGEDVHMTDSQEVTSMPREPGLPSFHTPSAPNTQPRSQNTTLTRMAHNSQPNDYHNSASTTTSGQKTSDRSNRTSDRSKYNTQSTNGVTPGGAQHPDFSVVGVPSGGSQLPDTQEVTYASSQPTNSQPSQSSPPTGGPARAAAPRPDWTLHPNARMPAPSSSSSPASGAAGGANATPRQPTAISSILNEAPEEPSAFALDESLLASLRAELVAASSGLSVEQLEQVNAALMDAVWKSRMKWNRNHVAGHVRDAFNATIADIQEMQKVWPPSQAPEAAAGARRG